MAKKSKIADSFVGSVPPAGATRLRAVSGVELTIFTTIDGKLLVGVPTELDVGDPSNDVGRRWIPMKDEAKQDFVVRARRAEPLFDIRTWVKVHEDELRAELPANFTGQGW